jgi:hypothetical protein
VHRAVLARRRLHRGLLLHVVGQDHAGDGALVARDAHGAIDEVPHLARRHRGLHELVGDVLEQRLQVHLLLVVAAHGGARLLADDGHHRLVVGLGVVQAIEQVDRARPRGGQAHAHLAGELGMRARHEGRQLFMPRLHELQRRHARERGDHAVDAVARIPEHAPHAPRLQALEDLVTHCLAAHASQLRQRVRARRQRAARGLSAPGSAAQRHRDMDGLHPSRCGGVLQAYSHPCGLLKANHPDSSESPPPPG